MTIYDLLDGMNRALMEGEGCTPIWVEEGDDRAVGAFIRVSTNGMLVRMAEPFPGLFTDCSVLTRCKRRVEELAPGETMTERGARKAERLLREMLVEGRWIEGERDALLKDIERLREEVREERRSVETIGYEEYWAARRVLRACLRSGMSVTSYQRRLNELRRKPASGWCAEDREVRLRLGRLIHARHGMWIERLDQWIARLEDGRK